VSLFSFFEIINHLSFSKPGRPPSKKGGVGDRKGLARLKRPVLNGSEVSGRWSSKLLCPITWICFSSKLLCLIWTCFLRNWDLICICLVPAESDDDHEELMAAVQASINASCRLHFL
jgi:hypothetical protein